MSVRNLVETPEAMAGIAPSLKQWDCERYHDLISAGLLTKEDKIELIDGYLFTKIFETKHGELASVPTLMRWNCERYHRLIEGGFLTEEDRVELIDGYILTKMPIGSKHSAMVNRLTSILVGLFGKQGIVSIQNPIILPDYSEPEPDVSVAKFREDYYSERHPYPEDVMLVIEVADSSLDYDKNIKIPLYASCGIPEAWLVDLNQRLVTVCRQPEENVYREQRVYAQGDAIPVPGASDAFVSVDQLGM